MTTEYLNGDLFLTKGIQGFFQGCNAQGAMGKGIAAEFKKKWPQMYKEYKQECKQGKLKLGDVFHWVDKDLHIFNLITQPRPGPYAELHAIEKAIDQAIRLCILHKVNSVAIPKIGAGLGGLPWESVKEIIENRFSKLPIKALIIEEYIQGLKPISKSET